MGAHESNSGLCAALHRMYQDLGCLSAETEETEGQASSKSVPGHPEQQQVSMTQSCKEIVERIIARGCAPAPESVSAPPKGRFS